jgi:hypothetical protein
MSFDMRIFLSTVLKTEGYEPIPSKRNAIEGIQKARDMVRTWSSWTS